MTGKELANLLLADKYDFAPVVVLIDGKWHDITGVQLSEYVGDYYVANTFLFGPPMGVAAHHPVVKGEIMDANDNAATHFQSKFAANYGAGIIPWPAIISAILSMLGGCLTPTPSNVRAQMKRLIPQWRLHRKLLDSGVPASQCGRVVTATAATIEGATDDELASYLAAAQESE